MSASIGPPHSCRHCQRLVLRRKHFKTNYCSIDLPHTPADIWEALKDECVFFLCFFPLGADDGGLKQSEVATSLQRKSNLYRELQAKRPSRSGLLRYLDSLKFKSWLGSFSLIIRRESNADMRGTSYVMVFLYEGQPILQRGTDLKASLGVAAEELSDRVEIAQDPYVGSESSLSRARQWLSTCHATHRLCSQPVDDFVPTRLLKIVRIDDGTAVRLVEFFQGNRVKWAALTYVWGGDQTFKSTTALMGMMRKNFPVQDLPATIQDAIKVCEEVGLQHIWIDSLCIIQDDNEDVNRELAVMPKIYERAWVTISASSASGVSEGFLHDRHPKSLDPNLEMPVALPYMSKDDQATGTVIMASTKTLEEDHRSVPINSRAWTYQERRLSPRLLDFNSVNLTFVCRTGRFCQGDGSLDWGTDRGRDWMKHQQIAPCLEGQHLPAWHSIVEDYASRQLTYPADKLKAIAALADVYKKRYNHTYIAGLWKESLLDDICWVVASEGSNEPTRRLKRPIDYRAPTWSWAAIDICQDSKVLHFDNTQGEPRSHSNAEVPSDAYEYSYNGVNSMVTAIILHVAVQQSQRNTTYSQIYSAHLDLEGYAVETTLDTSSWSSDPSRRVQIFQDALDPEWKADPSHTAVVLFALKTGLRSRRHDSYTFGLILVVVRGDCHRRIGAFQLTKEADNQPYSSIPVAKMRWDRLVFKRRMVKIV